MSLLAEADSAGKIVRCPGCNTKMQIPENIAGATSSQAPSAAHSKPAGGKRQGPAPQPGNAQRVAWKEQDPTNPNGLVSFGIGLALAFVWFIMVYPLKALPGKAVSAFTGGEFLANVFYKHFAVSFANTLFFCWAMTICWLKLKKLRHQREALFLDALPMELGKEINAQNVGNFIDRLYALPWRLRDSLMVNRLRKALEFFEVRQNVSDVSAMMSSQSAIDGSRISGSYIMLRAFLWAIPLLGFIGTVVGLSHAIGGMNFENSDKIEEVVGSLKGVTSGLGTAFDATLLGLILAVTLNFPLNSLAKHEDEMLNDIDAFCNEVLLPRLNDGAGAGGGNLGAVADSVVKALSGAQQEFLQDLNALSARMNEYAENLDHRIETHQAMVTEEFVTNMTKMRSEVEHGLHDAMKTTTQYLGALETGVRGLNKLLSDLGEKQVIIQQVKKKGWFSRD